VKLRLLIIAAVAWSSLAHAATPDEKIRETIKQNLESRFPQNKIEDVQPGPVPGIYEVFTGDNIVYSNKTGDYLFIGQLMDTRTKTNVSAERMDERNAVEFAKLPFDQAIKIVKGDGARKVALFVDPDCPYCRQLEKDLQAVDNITTYVFLYPIASLHPDATAKSHAIWCAPDRATAWTQWMLERKAPDYTTCEGDPVDALQSLGHTLRINSTPTLFFENGRRFSGAPPADRLSALLDTPAKQNRHTAQQ
jgi:thiol:disulfide interchange protein DsbC